MSDLPTWEQMSDLDRGAALLHVHTREYQGSLYAEEHAPAEFFTDRALVALTMQAGSDHAVALCGSWPAMVDRIGDTEAWRLVDLADAARQRRIRAGW